MIEIALSDAPDQEFALILEGESVIMRLRWNPTVERWHMDLRIATEVVMVGRRVVPGVDLIEPFDFGIGRIFAWPINEGATVNYDDMVSGATRLFQANDADLIAAGAAV